MCTLAYSYTAILAAPANAKPTPEQTIKQLRTEIAKLKKQITSLKAENSRLKGTAAGVTTTTSTLPNVTGGRSPFLVGNAHPTYPAGMPGEVSLVYTGPLKPNFLSYVFQPFVVRNNTSEPVSDVRVEATIYSGDIIEGTESNLGGNTDPSVIEPGQWAYGYISYNEAPQSSMQVKYSVTSSAPENNAGDLKVLSADLMGDTISVLVTNQTSQEIDAFTHVTAFCLNSSGNPTYPHDELNRETLAPNIKKRYKIGLSTGPSCKSFLVGATYN